MIDLEKPIGEIAAENASALDAFEKLGIDYCCHGESSFAEAAKSIGVTPAELFSLIEIAHPRLSSGTAKDWTHEPLHDLIHHVVDKHHAFTRSELERLEGLCDEVITAHRQDHPELRRLKQLFGRVREDLLPHMLNEEQIVFPFIVALEQALRRGRPVAVPPFATLEHILGVMHVEHDRVVSLLRDIRDVTTGFEVPLDGSASYRLLMTGLLALEQDLHVHVHLENNVLFPRAVSVEDTAVAELFYDFGGESSCEC